MVDILKMSGREILSILPGDIDRILSAEEIIRMAAILGSFWSYDYAAVKSGLSEKHFKLKSGLHSDGFFIPRSFFKYPIIKIIMAEQLVLHFDQLDISEPDWVINASNEATDLAKEFASLLHVKFARMEKNGGEAALANVIPSGDSVLFLDTLYESERNFCEVAQHILVRNGDVRVLPYGLVIINRTRVDKIDVPGVDSFQVVATVCRETKYWEEEDCPLCNDHKSSVLRA